MHKLTLEIIFEYTDMEGNHVVYVHYLDKIVRMVMQDYRTLLATEIIGIKTMDLDAQVKHMEKM